MQKSVVKAFMVILCAILLCGLFPPAGWTFFWTEQPLVTIDGQDWSRADYQAWWRVWKESDDPVPETIDSYIDWLLLSDEAERMQLYEEPRYQQKIKTFLKVRSLMQLKQEEVDSKISLSPQEIEAVYQQEYTPLLTMRYVQLESQERCEEFLTKAEQGMTSEQVIAASEDINSDALAAPILQRPNQLPDHIRTLYEATPQDRYLEPYEFKGQWFIIEIVERSPGNDQDLAIVENTIKTALAKKKQHELTSRLTQRLREKYRVSLDTTLVDKIHLEGPEEQIQDQPVIHFPDMDISAQVLYDNAIKHYRQFGGEKIKDRSFTDIVTRVANDIISQTLTTLEALNRHYEQREPFQSVFSFYQRHRLIRELESVLIVPKINVTEAQLRAYYTQHREEYASPERASYLAAETNNQKLAQQLNERLRHGESYESVVAELVPLGVEVKTTPMSHMVSEFADMVRKLPEGQAAMLELDGTSHFIKLVDSAHIDYAPYEAVKSRLEERLKEQQFTQIRQALVAQLRERASILVNEAQWQRCIHELKGQ